MSILWTAVVGAGVYIVLLHTALLLARARGNTAWLVKSRLPGTKHLLRSFAGASVVGVTLVAASGCGSGGTAAHSGGRHTPPPILVPAGALPRNEAPTVPAQPQTEPGAADATPADAAPASLTPAETATAASARPPTVEQTSAITEWTVRSGDDLWSITESVLAGRLGRQPTDREVASLWLRVIDVNSATLPDPGNPGLIFAGEVVAVPW